MKPREWTIYLPTSEVYGKFQTLEKRQNPDYVDVIEKSAYDQLLTEAWKMANALEETHMDGVFYDFCKFFKSLES